MRTQSGQALVLLLGMLAAACAALLMVFETGQVTSQKQRLVNVADAAAFSAAAWQARSLNLQAYLNRAIVANEAAVGQSVSLRSFSGYVGHLTQNAAQVGQVVPQLGPVLAALANLWGGFDQALQPTLAGAETALSVIDHDFALLQQVTHGSAVPVTQNLVDQVVAANEPTARVSGAGRLLLADDARRWLALTSTYDGWQRDRQRQVILDSLDPFTRSRGHTWQAPLLPLARLEKRGGTELLGYEAWRGVDTLALHLRAGILFGRWRERVPLGWGAAETVRFDAGQAGSYGGSLQVSPRTSRLALAAVRGGAGYLGLPGMRDIAQPWRQDDRGIRVVVEVERALATVPLARAGLAGAHVRLPGGEALPAAAPPRATMRALGAARVEFVRPEGRVDGLRELPSLFNPYWQARLDLPAPAERALAAAVNVEPDVMAVLP